MDLDQRIDLVMESLMQKYDLRVFEGGDPYRVLIRTILSQRTRDENTDRASAQLFSQYHTMTEIAGADPARLEPLIRPAGFYRVKAQRIVEVSKKLLDEFKGQVPDDIKNLLKLPGVGRKTANVILGNAFDIPGITVDTHFGRLVRRWRWTAEEDPVKVEHAVGELIPRKEWTLLSHRVIFHGRRVCHSRTPACGVCVLARDCPSYGLGPTDLAAAAALVKGPETEHLLALAGITE